MELEIKLKQKHKEDFLKEGLPRLLYTGTCEEYFQQKILKEKFDNQSGRHSGIVYMSDSFVSATGYAIKRAAFYKDLPLLLIIDTKKLDEKVEYSGEYSTSSLNANCFLTYALSLGIDSYEGLKVRFKDNLQKDIKCIKDTVSRLSKKEIESYWKDYSYGLKEGTYLPQSYAPCFFAVANKRILYSNNQRELINGVQILKGKKVITPFFLLDKFDDKVIVMNMDYTKVFKS